MGLRLSGYFKYFGIGKVALGTYAAVAPPAEPEPAAIRWETDPDLGTVSQGESFTRMVRASSPDAEIEGYDLQGLEAHSLSASINPFRAAAALPETLKFDRKTGRMSGYYTDQDFDAPTWGEPAGLIGEAIRFEAFERVLSAIPAEGRDIATYGIVGRNPLPAGLTLMKVANTAVIAGDADLYANDLDHTRNTEGPVWSNTSTQIGTYETSNTSLHSFTFVAEPREGNSVTYRVAGSRRLPNGFVLDGITGSMTGNVAPADYTTLPFEPASGVTWITPEGHIGDVATGNAATRQFVLSAQTEAGGAISYAAVGGVPLPAGLTLFSANGVVGGVIDRDFHAPLPIENPGTVTWTTPPGDLGTSRNGQPISASLHASSLTGTQMSFQVVAGSLPGGATLQITNAAIGAATIAGNADGSFGDGSLPTPRTFNFTIRGSDEFGGVDDRVFSYTISP